MYAVVRTTNYDNDVEVIVCKTEKEAEKTLEKDWEEYYNIELAESSFDLVEEECFHETDYAQIEYDNENEYEPNDQVYWFIVKCRKP